MTGRHVFVTTHSRIERSKATWLTVNRKQRLVEDFQRDQGLAGTRRVAKARGDFPYRNCNCLYA
jgi:hypothetical protein